MSITSSDTGPRMTSNKPYLIRALYEWVLDNNLTPHVVVDATLEGVVVPVKYIEDGKIVLNISPMAVKDLEMLNEGVFFSARFGGVAMSIAVPTYAVIAVYAQENGRG
ncbi:MAG: ClpXP protease specificity-enhancing factor, partial [Pseudomonadota bacterium]